jgi:hypothetical protein
MDDRISPSRTDPVAQARYVSNARARLSDAQKGLDLASLKQAERDADSFKVLTGRYLAEHARVKKKPRSAVEDEKNITESCFRFGEVAKRAASNAAT